MAKTILALAALFVSVATLASATGCAAMFPSPLERRETYVSAHGDQLDPRTESLILEVSSMPEKRADSMI